MFSRIVLFFALAAMGVAGCGGADGSRPIVVTSFYPLAFAVEEIAGTSVEVVNLTAPGVEPHDLELTAKQAREIAEATLVVFYGGGFQPGVEDAAARRAGESLDLRPTGGGVDPHAWLDPVSFADAVRRIGRALRLPAEGDALARRVDALHADFTKRLATCDRRVIVTSHAAFGRLAARYRLRQVALTGIEPGSEPSPGAVARLVDTVIASGATTVFVEPLLEADLARVVAREAGVVTATLDPLESLTETAIADGADYFSVMRENLATLERALGCR